jgi:hypothetical protein
MKAFVLQNSDLTQFFWSEEMGWVELDSADPFFGYELSQQHCNDLLEQTKGRWVITEISLKEKR